MPVKARSRPPVKQCRTAGKLLDLLNIPQSERDFAALGAGRRIAPGTTLPPPAPVFPRYVEPETAKA